VTEAHKIRLYLQAAEALKELGLDVEQSHDLFSVSWSDRAGIVLFENFETVAELVAFARGLSKGREIPCLG
jgi:hypothetical protein